MIRLSSTEKSLKDNIDEIRNKWIELPIPLYIPEEALSKGRLFLCVDVNEMGNKIGGLIRNDEKELWSKSGDIMVNKENESENEEEIECDEYFPRLNVEV